MSRSGFTLVEILAAMLVLEVGLMGVVGTLWLAARTLTRAEVLEHGVEAMEGVYDSLAMEPSPTDGSRLSPSGQIGWRVSGADARLWLIDGGGDTLARVEARLPPGDEVRR